MLFPMQREVATAPRHGVHTISKCKYVAAMFRFNVLHMGTHCYDTLLCHNISLADELPLH